jgi:concanavalin A-like lectin/glucanase superfamily protein
MKPVRVVTALAVLFSLAVPAAASAGTADFPLRGWWPLNEGRGQTVYDWSGKGNNGFLGSTPTVDANDPAWTKGIFFGSALSFGGDDFISVNDSNTLEPQSLTVSAWIKAPQSPGPYKYILAKGSQDCVTASYGLTTSWNGGLQFYVWDQAGQRQLSGGLANASIYDGKWHHVAGTFDGVLVKLFVDGKEQGEGASVPATVDYLGPRGPTTIGGYHGSCDLMFSGDIDEIHIWSQALPIKEIWAKWGWLLGIPGRM